MGAAAAFTIDFHAKDAASCQPPTGLLKPQKVGGGILGLGVGASVAATVAVGVLVVAMVYLRR